MSKELEGEKRDATRGRNDAPRVNTGRSTSADEIRVEEARAKLEYFGELRRARGAAEAGIIRVLATVYDIAMDRALAAINDTYGTGEQSKLLSWNFTSLISDFAIKTNDSPRALTNRGYDAHELVTNFPEWVEAIEAGEIDVAHARGMLSRISLIKEEQYAEYSEKLLAYAMKNSAGKTASEADRLASEMAAEEFEQTCEIARAARNVTITYDAWGMAILRAYLPSELAAPIKELLDKQAKEIREANEQARKDALGRIVNDVAQRVDATGDSGAGAGAGVGESDSTTPDPAATDSRTMDQIRADIFAETLLCATPGESRVTATVNVTIPALSLLEGREDGTAPALLDGMHPMSFTEASQLTAEAPSWRRVFTDPIRGNVIAVDTYHPSPALRRLIQIRDRTCRFPGCVRPATRCDIDHTQPASEGGKTSADNLSALCKSHHVLKHEKPWAVTNLGDGILEWRTPLGQVVESRPMPYSSSLGPSNLHVPTETGPEFRPTNRTAVLDVEDSQDSVDDGEPPF